MENEEVKIGTEQENKPKKEPLAKRFLHSMFPAKGDSAKDVIFKMLVIVCIIVFFVAASILITQLLDYFNANNLRNDVKNVLSQPPTQSEIEQLPEGAEKDFAALYAQNPDFIGWIQIPDTALDYPVVHSKDNEDYLYKDFKGQKQRLGTVFVDFRNKITKDAVSDNTVIYGHSAKDGSYFKSLMSYKDFNYYKSHAFINFDTLYGKGEYVIVGAFMAGIYPSQGELFEYHNFIDAASEEDFNKFVNEVKRRSYMTPEVDVKYGDKLITLSTCDYEFKDSRFVVVARKLREGETKDSFNTQAVVDNTARFMPDAWYKAKAKTNPNPPVEEPSQQQDVPVA